MLGLVSSVCAVLYCTVWIDLGRARMKMRGHSPREYVCDHSTPSDDCFYLSMEIFGRELGEAQTNCSYQTRVKDVRLENQ